MPLIVDPSFVPPAPPETILSSDKVVRATVDSVNAGCLLKANFAEQVLRTNLVTNPSFRKTSGTVEVWRNLITNPSFETGMTGTIGNAATMSQSTDQAKVGTYSAKATLTANAGPLGWAAYWSVTGLTVGTQYTLAFWVYVPAGAEIYAPTARVSGLVSGTSTTSTGWQHLSVTFTATATGHNMGLTSTGAGTVPVGTVYYMDAGILVVGSTVPDYFDGSTAAADGLTYSWTGAAHTSASVATGASIAAWNGSDGTRIQGPIVGDGFAMDVRNSHVSYSPAAVAGLDEWYAGRVTLQAIEGETTNTAIQVRLHDGANYLNGSTNVVLPLDGTPVVIDLTPIAATTANSPRIYFYPNGNAFRVTDSIMEKVSAAGETCGPRFDGSTPATEFVEYRWTGAADASTSEEFVPALVDGDGNLPSDVRFYRSDGTLVRSGDPAVATDGIAYAYDHEMDLGGASAWYAKPIMADGTEGVATQTVAVAIPEPSDESDGWIKSTVNPSLSMPVRLALAEEGGRQTRVTIDEVTGSQYGALTWDTPVAQVHQVTARTSGKADYDKLMSILTAGPLLLQAQDGTGLPKTVHVIPIGTIAATRLIETGAAWDYRHWALSLREIERPATIDTPLRIPGKTCQQLPEGYATCADLLAQVATCGTLLEG